MSTYSKGLALEREVVDLYRSLGARVVHNSIVNGCQVDLIVETELAGSPAKIRTIVECKDFARPVGVEAVNAFAVVFINLRHTGEVDKAIMVSRSGFSAAAKAAATAHSIILLELEELKSMARAAPPTLARPPEIQEVTPDRKYVFVLIPFDEDFDNIFWFGIRGAVEDADLYCQRADEIHFTGNVLDKINEEIRRADVIVAEMTGRNPNVFYEVGIAHTVGKPTVLLVQNAEDIPFDLRPHNHLVYDPKKIKELKARLCEMLNTIIG